MRPSLKGTRRNAAITRSGNRAFSRESVFHSSTFVAMPVHNGRKRSIKIRRNCIAIKKARQVGAGSGRISFDQCAFGNVIF